MPTPLRSRPGATRAAAELFAELWGGSRPKAPVTFLEAQWQKAEAQCRPPGGCRPGGSGEAGGATRGPRWVKMAGLTSSPEPRHHVLYICHAYSGEGLQVGLMAWRWRSIEEKSWTGMQPRLGFSPAWEEDNKSPVSAKMTYSPRMELLTDSNMRML